MELNWRHIYLNKHHSNLFMNDSEPIEFVSIQQNGFASLFLHLLLANQEWNRVQTELAQFRFFIRGEKGLCG